MSGVAFSRLKTVAVSGLVIGMAVAPAHAAWTVSASGLWNTNAPVTSYSAPFETYSFSFSLPGQSFTTIYQDSNVSVTTQLFNVHYSLNGVAVPVTLWTGPQSGCFGQAVGTLCNVAFFDTNLAGGIALAFSDHVIEFYGVDIGGAGTLVPGNYSFVPNIDNSYVNEGTAVASVAPEPAGWVFMLLGVGAVGAATRAGRRRAITA